MIIILLFVLSIAPLVLAYILLRRRLRLPVFLAAVLCGVAAVVLAALIQGAFPAPEFGSKAQELRYFFVHIALIEEGARFVMLALFFAAADRLNLFQNADNSETDAETSPNFAAVNAAGLIAGLAFAALETAIFAASNAATTVVRLCTAAPLHGACAARVAQAASAARKLPSRSVSRFLSAAALHGVYDFMIGRTALFTALAALLAITSLITIIWKIRGSVDEQ